MATENVGPARHCRLGPASVAEAIERPRRILIASTETRPDGSSFDTTLEFTFEPRGGSAGSTAELAASRCARLNCARVRIGCGVGCITAQWGASG